MADVSLRILKAHLEHVEHRGLATEENLSYVLSGLRVQGLTRPADWRSLSNSGCFEWEDYVLLVSRIKELFPRGQDWVADFVEASFYFSKNNPIFSYVMPMARYALSVKQFFYFLKSWAGPSLFKCIEHDWIEHGRNTYQMNLTIPEPLTIEPDFFKICQLNFTRFPVVLGLPEPQVELQQIGRTGRYLISSPDRTPFRDRARMVITALRSLPALLKFLREHEEAEQANYRVLWNSRQELESVHAELEERIQQRTMDLKLANMSLQEKMEESRRTEEFLRASERRYRHVVENSVSGIWELDSRLHTVFVNQSFCEVIGYSQEELLGRSPFDFVVSEAHEQLRVRFENRKKGIAEKYTLPFRHKNGSVLLLQVDTAPMISNGEFQGAAAIINDITDEVREQENKIQIEVEKRQVQKLEALGTLAGGVAHDFNNILQGIYSSLGLALQQLDDDHPAKSRVKSAMDFGERGRKVVEQILLFSRDQESEREALDLIQMVQEVLPLLKESSSGVLDIEFNSDLTVAPVLGNANELTQALLNFCTNSAFACRPRGRFRIEIEEVQDGRSPASYLMKISDSGPGIPPRIRDKIFEPFFSTKPIGSGTGMGLALSQGIAKRHKGQLELDPNYSEGARFLLTLPGCEGYSPLSSIKGHPIVRGGGERILLVEDEPVILELIQTQLREIGYQVTGARNGVEALLKYEASPEEFDLILSDLNMPEMSGDLLVECLQRGGWSIPVILFTGFRIPESLKNLQDTNLAACLSKPISMAQLSKTLREVLGGLRSVQDRD